MGIGGFTAYPPGDRELYNRRRWWHGMTWGDLIDKATDLYPEKVGKVEKKALRENIRRRL
jgi:hypothetical protein